MIVAHALTDFQGACEHEGVLRALLSACDWVYRRLHGLTDPRAEVGLALRVRLARYRGRPFALADGTAVRRGDLVGDFHLHNERVAALHEGDARSPRAALAFRRAFMASLSALAERALTDPAYRDVRAFTATTIFHTGTERAGFETRPLRHPLMGRLVAAYERALLRRLHPLGAARPGRFRFAEARQIWISRETLIRRYASATSSASGTHA